MYKFFKQFISRCNVLMYPARHSAQRPPAIVKNLCLAIMRFSNPYHKYRQ